MRGLRLRTRVTLSFALGALLVSSLLAVATFGITRETTLRQRQNSSQDQFFKNLSLVREQLNNPRANIDQILDSLPGLAGSRPLLFHDGEWITTFLQPADVPERMRDVVVTRADVPFRQRYSQGNRPQLALGMQVPATDSLYFEVIPLEELNDILRRLALTLALTGLVTTVAGALVGIWVSSRVLRPVRDISGAAEAIAGGRLDTRLEHVDDPDLASLVDPFNDMASALEARIDRDARFASDVSHELRSPLMTLRASIAVLEARRDDLSERSQAALDLLVEDVIRFEGLVENLLEISRADAGQADMAIDSVNVAELVMHTVESAPDPAVPISIEEDAMDTVIRGDKRRLAQVITNLLDNAAKHGGGATSVDVKREDGAIRIIVEDEGPGIPRDESELVFERFARGMAARSRGAGAGAGLGLALVQEHVRLHKGEVWVEDRSDGMAGARFVVELPITKR